MQEKIEIYESLLNQAASLEKECFHISLDYVREFGEENNNIFALKIACIELKKKIAYCVKAKNNNILIDLEKMKIDIDKAMKAYKTQLNQNLEFAKYATSDKGKEITFDDRRSIKQMYYKIVHLIHPDLHPEYIKNKKVNDLWLITVDAYKRNDMKTLRRAYDQVLIMVGDFEEIVLDNIDVKISIIEEEIKTIKENAPYTYKFILQDEDEIINLHNKNRETEKYYKNYKENLELELSKFFEDNKKCEA